MRINERVDQLISTGISISEAIAQAVTESTKKESQ